MQNIISHVNGEQTKDITIGQNETKNGYEAINNPENFCVVFCRGFTLGSKVEREQTGNQVHQVVDCVNRENADNWVIKETQNTDNHKNYTKYH